MQETITIPIPTTLYVCPYCGDAVHPGTGQRNWGSVIVVHTLCDQDRRREEAAERAAELALEDEAAYVEKVDRDASH